MRRIFTLPKVGERKIETRFLLLPKRIGSEWRWLKKVKIEYQRVDSCCCGSHWQAVGFIEN